MFAEQLRQSRVLAAYNIRKNRRRMRNKTRRKKITTELRCIDRSDSTRLVRRLIIVARRPEVMLREHDLNMISWRNR